MILANRRAAPRVIGAPSLVKENPNFKTSLDLFARRVAVLDGAMGTMIQARGLEEADFRGERFRDHPCDLRGRQRPAHCLTRRWTGDRGDPRRLPPRRRGRHHQDQHLQCHVDFPGGLPDRPAGGGDQHRRRRDRLAGRARAARKRPSPRRRCFVAGAIGPTNRTLSLSPDVNRPDYRAVFPRRRIKPGRPTAPRPAPSPLPGWMP